MPDFSREASDVAVRFHRATEWYTTTLVGDVHAVRAHANSERAVELFFRLSAYLDEIVDLVVIRARDGATWEGVLRFLPDVRDAVGRLRWPLAMHGGVELTLVTERDQLTLTPQLDVVIYSRSARWPALLEAEGVPSHASPARPSWNASNSAWPEAPALDTALNAMIERLTLAEPA